MQHRLRGSFPARRPCGARDPGISLTAKPVKGVPLPMIENEVNSKTLADWLRISERSVRAMADEGIVKRAGRGRYLLKESVQAVVEHQRGIAAGRGGASQVLDLTAERARLAKEQADGQELKNRVARGELLVAADVERTWSDALRRLRAGMLAVTGRVRAATTIEAADAAIIDREIRDALTALSGGEDDPGEGAEESAPASEA